MIERTDARPEWSTTEAAMYPGLSDTHFDVAAFRLLERRAEAERRRLAPRSDRAGAARLGFTVFRAGVAMLLNGTLHRLRTA